MAEVEAPEVPQHEEAHADILSGDDTAGLASASEVETETEKETEKEVTQKEAAPKDAATNGTKKENVLPKRPSVAAARRPGVASTASAMKPTASATASKTTGGLSKPPTRPVAGSIVRKPASTATAPTSASSSHRSQPSVGGSGDEKKKPLTAAARRTSLAPSGAHHTPSGAHHTPSGAHHTPVKTETLAEKRASTGPTTTVRKPVTSVSSSSPKPAVKHATSTSTTRSTGTAGSTVSRSAPISKPAAGGAVADTKKRLSTIAGSPGASRTATRPASHSASASVSSKEIEELKAKLEDSETRVEELQKEISSSQEKLLELGKRMEDEAHQVTVAEENIRAQHNEIVEKLHATHTANIEGLQAKLAEAEVAQKAAQDASVKAIEDAQQAATAKGASETAEALEKLRVEHVSALEAVNLELANAKKASATAASAISEKEEEIASLKSQLEAAKTEVETLKAEYETKLALQAEANETALSDLRKSLAAEHESALAALKAAHSADLLKGSTDVTSAYEKQVADLTVKHETSSKALQKQLQEAIAAQTTLETSHKKILEVQQAESSAKISKITSEIAELQGKSGSTEKQLLLAQEKLKAALKKHETVEAKAAEFEKTVVTTKNELAKKEEDLISLKTMMDADGKSKDELFSKVQADLASTSKSLDDKTKEISMLQEKHRKELETISSDYEKEIDALQGNSGMKEELEALQAKHKELTKTHTDATASHTKTLEQLKQDYAAAIATLDNKETAHQKALEELKAIHAKNLDEAHDRAITAGHATHAAELEQLQANHADAIAALTKGYETSQAKAASDADKRKAAETALQAEIEKTKQSLLKTQDELDTLKQNLAHEKMARASAEADLDAVTSKKPDTSEADGLRKELQALKDQHQAGLMTAQQESAKATEEHLAVKASLEKAQAELEKQKSDAAARSKTAEADYNDLNTSMTELVEEANKKAVDLEARLKEAEANLVVKDAEIAEEKAKSATLPAPKTPTKPAQGLAASRFAEELDEPVEEPESEAAAEGEQDSSSTALASLAKARVIAQQLDQMNEDSKRDNLRSLQSIIDVSPNSHLDSRSHSPGAASFLTRNPK